MRIPKDMEPMVFSFAYYNVRDFDKLATFLQTMENKGFFIVDEHKPKKKKFVGSFVRDYPKGHWSPFAHRPGAKQVMGSANIRDGVLKLEARTKGTLDDFRKIIDENLADSVEFDRVEYRDIIKELMQK
ncbi:MAG: hypothetical protein ABH879_04645 [archaeon]